MVNRVWSAVSFKTYKMMAKRYKIKLSYVRKGKRIQKSLYQLRDAIYNYEERNNVTNGMYF